MAFDDGLTARERARIRRARKRAGVRVPPVRGESAADKAKTGRRIRVEEDGSILYPNGTVRDAETRKIRPAVKHPAAKPAAAPVRGEPASGKSRFVARGESASDKSRVAIRGRARDAFDDLAFGRLSAQQFVQRMAGLKAAEKRDLQSYSRARSEQIMDDVLQRQRDSLKRFPEQATEVVAGHQIAKLVPGGMPASDVDPKWLAAEMAMLAPATLVGKPIAAAFRTGRAVKRGEPVGLAGRKLRTPEPRTSTYGDLKTQFPNAPSRGTQKAQRGKDRLFEATGRAADALRDSDSLVVRGVGMAITPFSARAAVPKQAGKLRAKERARARALRAGEIRTVRRVGRVLPGMRTEPAQAAHTWLAQLPAEYRVGTKGYELIKRNLAGELDRYVSGAYSKQLDDAEAAIRGELSDAVDATERFKLMSELEKLDTYRADIPARIKDLTTDLRKLDKLITKPPKINPEVVDAIAMLGRDSEDIYVAAGVLKPETAEARRELKSRWLGLEPTGEEAYIGDRLAKGRAQRHNPVGGIGLGRTRLPQGVATQNTLHLVKTGRARKNLGVVVEDWENAQKYQFNTEAKNDLAALGKPFTGTVPDGYAVVNPRGHEVPRRIHADDEAQALAEGFDPDVIDGDVAEYASNYLASGRDEVAALLEKAGQYGHLQDLKIVPVDVVRRYVSQFEPTKIQALPAG